MQKKITPIAHKQKLYGLKECIETLTLNLSITSVSPAPKKAFQDAEKVCRNLFQ